MRAASKRGPKPSISTERAQEFKDIVMRLAFDMPPVPVTEEDLVEITAAERAIARETVQQRVRGIARLYGRSEKTVAAWVREGLDVHDVIETDRFVTWKDTRARNRRHLDGRPRRIRNPFD